VNFGGIYDSETGAPSTFLPVLFWIDSLGMPHSILAIFDTAKRSAQLVLDFELLPSTGSLDCSTAISGAYQGAWPDITLVTCWPHVFQNCTTKIQLLMDKAYTKPTIIPDLRRMQESGPFQHFSAISKAVLEKWRSDGESAYASEFEASYLTEPFNTWFIGATKHPGMLAQQQGIEAFNKSIKTT
jgi:hypothetical protein